MYLTYINSCPVLCVGTTRAPDATHPDLTLVNTATLRLTVLTAAACLPRPEPGNKTSPSGSHILL